MLGFPKKWESRQAWDCLFYFRCVAFRKSILFWNSEVDLRKDSLKTVNFSLFRLRFARLWKNRWWKCYWSFSQYLKSQFLLKILPKFILIILCSFYRCCLTLPNRPFFWFNWNLISFLNLQPLCSFLLLGAFSSTFHSILSASVSIYRHQIHWLLLYFGSFLHEMHILKWREFLNNCRPMGRWRKSWPCRSCLQVRFSKWRSIWNPCMERKLYLFIFCCNFKPKFRWPFPTWSMIGWSLQSPSNDLWNQLPFFPRIHCLRGRPNVSYYISRWFA